MNIDQIKDLKIRDALIEAGAAVLSRSTDMTQFGHEVGQFLNMVVSDPAEPKTPAGVPYNARGVMVVAHVWTDGEGKITKSSETIHYSDEGEMVPHKLVYARDNINQMIMEALEKERRGIPHRPFYEFFSTFQV